MNKSVPKNAAYIIYGALAKRSGGVFNKDLDFNLNKITGTIYDVTKPYVVRVTNEYPEHMSEDNEVIRQNTQAQEPNIYITVSEDCTFPNNMTALLYSGEGNYTVSLKYVGKHYFNTSNGDVTYKFRIGVEELYNNNINRHFDKVTIKFVLTDTFGNKSGEITQTINKRIDTKPPVITNDGYPNVFKVSDAFGLSKITTTMTSSNNISNTYTILDLEKTKLQLNLLIKAAMNWT